jgi:predicted permease
MQSGFLKETTLLLHHLWRRVEDWVFTELSAAVRGLRRRRLTSLVAALSLGIGMSLATAVFAMINSLIIQQPFQRASSVYRVEERMGSRARSEFVLPGRHIAALRSDPRLAGRVASARSTVQARIGETGEARALPAIATTTNFFDVIGVRPLLGRTFQEGDATDGAPPVAIISYATWQTLFGGRPDIIGRLTYLNGVRGTVVGVMPEGFVYPRGTSVWLPFGDAELRTVASRPERDWPRYIALVGGERLQVGQLMTSVQTAISQSDIAFGASDVPRVQVLAISDANRKDNAELVLLWASLAVMIAILCAVNFATMSLALGLRRRQEFAVRSALGASRRRMAWTLLCESLLLAVAASMVAVIAGMWFAGFVRHFVADALPSDTWISASRMVAFGSTATVGVGLLFALAPAAELARADLRPFLTGSASLSSRRGNSLAQGRSLLVATQMALAVLCVTSVLSVIQTSRRFGDLGPGYAYEQIASGIVSVQGTNAREHLYETLAEFVSHAPSVDRAAVEIYPKGFGGAVTASPENRPTYTGGFRWVDAPIGVFEVLDLKPIAGRLPSRAEIAGGAPVAVLSEMVSRALFPDGKAVGQRIKVKQWGGAPVWLTVAGVVPNVRTGPDFAPREPPIYTSLHAGLDSGEARLIIRTQGVAMANLATIRNELRRFDPRVSVVDLRTVSEDVEVFRSQERRRVVFLNGIAVMALVLAGLGVYGLASFTTTARAKDLSIRLALGAASVEVWRIAIGDLSKTAVIGAIVGIAAAAPFAQVIGAMVPAQQQSPLPSLAVAWGPSALGAVTLLLVGVLGAFVPVRRALRQDIARVLR